MGTRLSQLLGQQRDAVPWRYRGVLVSLSFGRAQHAALIVDEDPFSLNRTRTLAEIVSHIGKECT